MAKKVIKKAVIAPIIKKKLIDQLKDKGFKMPHGYELAVRKKK